ncbi:MAG: response regulator transcription factor [Actinomycetota bacterium]|nr:response regulator transcription factor [Actinomycetota bacterium]
MASLLVAEDDEAIFEPLLRVLRRDGYKTEHSSDGRSALELAMTREFDLILLDLGLPVIDGIEVCRRLRSSGYDKPILLLTARADEVDKVVGLDVGADDYVTKPFSLAELLARIRALLRRADTSTSAAADLRIDVRSRRAWSDGIELELTLKEFDLLALLVEEAGHVVTRTRIMVEIWHENWFGSTKTLDMHVSSLRRKLGDDSADPRYITTVRGIGYRLEKS